MECPKCGYLMDAFTTECPKCKRLGAERKKTNGQIPQQQTGTLPQREQESTSAGAAPFSSTMTNHPRPADRNAAIEWARLLCANPHSAVVLDTETTGLGKTAEIVQIGIIDLQGNVLLDTLVRSETRKRMSSDASAVHGITMEMLQNAPTLRELLPIIQRLTNGRTIVAYNADFDERLIQQTAKKNGVDELDGYWHCAMLEYARFIGEVNERSGEYKWQKLPSAIHGAVGDCQATLTIIREMANATPTQVAKPAGCSASVMLLAIIIIVILFSMIAV